MTKDDKHKMLNSIIMDIEKQKHIIDRTFAFIQSTLISLEASEKLEGYEKDYLIKDLREKLNEKEKETAKLTGDIVANKLSIEPGASFTGSCSMGAVIKDIKDLGAKQTEKEKTA